MTAEQQLADFLRSTFRSVWAFELLLLMMEDPARCWAKADLVAALRASDAIVEQSVADLAVAGMIVPEQANSFRYRPASPALEALMEQARTRYRNAPDAVRRVIIRGRQHGIAAFADAFRLWKD
jgi:hypothetical protein